MQELADITIPRNLKFSDLNLSRDTSGTITFDWHPIERICQRSDIPIAVFRDESPDNVHTLIAAWYYLHRQQGGQVNLVAEVLSAAQADSGNPVTPISEQSGRA